MKLLRMKYQRKDKVIVDYFYMLFETLNYVYCFNRFHELETASLNYSMKQSFSVYDFREKWNSLYNSHLESGYRKDTSAMILPYFTPKNFLYYVEGCGLLKLSQQHSKDLITETTLYQTVFVDVNGNTIL